MTLSVLPPQPANSTEARLLSRLMLLMSKTNEPMAMTDGLGSILDVNEAMCRLMNGTRDGLLAMRVPDLLVGGEAEALRNRGLRHERGSLDGEADVRRPDGTEFRARFWEMEVQLEPGVMRDFIGLSTDATALDSQETNTILRAHFDDSPDGKLIVDANGQTIYANQRHHDLWGVEDSYVTVSFAERQARTHALMVDAEPFRRMIRTAAKEPRSYSACTVRLLTGKTLEVRTVPVLTDTGELIGRSFSARDISVEQERDRALRESENRYRTLVSSLPIGLVMQFADNRIGATNEAAERILGMTRDELLGLTSFDPRWSPIREDRSPLPPEEHPSVITARTGEPCKDVLIGMNHPDASIRWLLVNSVALRDEDGAINGTVVSFQDVTELREAQDFLVQARTAEAFNSLAAGIAHKLNNSLAAIVGNAYLAGLPAGLPAETVKSLGEVVSAASDATGLVRDLLALSGRTSSFPQRVPVTDCVRRVIERLAADESGRVELELEADMPSVLFDERSLEQLLLIFVRNALEAGSFLTVKTRTEPRDGERANVECASGPVAPGLYGVLEVKDDGPGLAPEIIGKIFQPFASTKFEGRGLGLAVAAGIAGSYHSVIEIESSKDGCLARLLIPLR